MESTVLAHILCECPGGETIPVLSWLLSPSEEGDLVERAVRELVRARLLRIEGGRVVPGDRTPRR